ncbi:MAG: MFS transporter [candidate division Zixibacteria bacterium]|nr:MFS transporter [candidate division Zixibacteria bacterium]
MSTEPSTTIPIEKTAGSGKIWNKNFILLWQGQLVSSFGDMFYEIALGFWVLAVTGSTAIMGTLMAASIAPRVIISPFAGVLVDRSNRKWLIVLMDVIRGIAIIFVAIAAYTGIIKVWMVFAAGVTMGVCAAFFDPSVSSSIPDIVPKTKIVKANSVFRMIHSVSGVMGSSIGGILYQALGAPLMFLINGLSYIFSAGSETFIKIPKIEREAKEFKFWSELKAGFVFIWNVKGLRLLMLLSAMLNFIAMIGFVLILPLFERTESLGPAKYGIVLAFFTAGMFLGMLTTSMIDIKPARRFVIFMVCGFIFSLCFAFFPVFIDIFIMSPLLFLAGFTNSIINIFIGSVLQLTVPQDKRGKVFSLLGTISGGLVPLGMAFGGILAEFIPIRILMTSSFTMMGLFFIPLLFDAAFRRFVNFNPEEDTLESIM